MSYDPLPERRCTCGHLATDHLWTAKAIKRCQRKKCSCLKFIERTQPPYPGWCHHKDQCAGKSSCPEDPTCAD